MDRIDDESIRFESPDLADVFVGSPVAQVWRYWSEPWLLERWFHSPSWTSEVKVLEQQAGGPSHIVMHGPDGEEVEGFGVLLEAVPEERLVFTNAYREGWIPAVPPSGTPLRTRFIEMSAEGGSTRYVVRALHWSEEARRQHRETGFHEGWEVTSRQLRDLARSLP